MKNFLKVFILAAGLILYFNVSSFAQIDLAVYGGYVFNGSMEVDGKDFDDFTAPQFGVKAHYNIELFPMLDVGLGVFYQYTNISFDEVGFEPSRTSIGVDLAFIFSVSPEFFPYVRAYYSFYDKWQYEEDISSGYGLGIGAGIEYTIMQNLRIFGEFMYEAPSWEAKELGVKYDLDATQLGVNVGLKFLI